MKRLLTILLRRLDYKALLFLLLSLGFLAMPRTAAAQQDLVDDQIVDVSDFCDLEFDCELESVAIIYDSTEPTQLDVLSETDVNLDALDDGWAAYDCGAVFEDASELDEGCADDDGSGSAFLSGSIPINAENVTFLYSLFTDSFLADVLNDDLACDDQDPEFCFAIASTAVDVVIGPIRIDTVSPSLITVGTSGTLTITGENLVDPFGGQPDVQTRLTSGTGSGFTLSSPDFSPDGSEGTVSYQAAQNATVGNWDIGISYMMGFTILLSVDSQKLTVGYPPASVTNVAPQPWQAGQSNFNVTITGQNFGPNPTLSIVGMGVSLISYTPNANGQSIVATVSVDLNTPTGNALVDVGPGYNGPFVCACTGSGHGTYSVTVQAATPPPPQILFNGTDVTGATVSVFAGQQIALTGVPPSGFLVTSGSWSNPAPGKVVGGYDNGSGAAPPGSAGGHVVAMPSTTCPTSDFCNFTYYYVSAVTDTLTLTYVFKNGTRSSATVTFNVIGPTGSVLPSASLQTDNHSVVITNATNGSAEMDMGNAPDPADPTGTKVFPSIGVIVKSSVVLPRGNLIWVQIIQSTTFSQLFTPTPGFTPPSDLGLGLDGGYPYPPLNDSSASDAPGRLLFSGMGEGAEAFDAIMYVMWDPAIPGPGQTSCKTARVDTSQVPYLFFASTCLGSIPVPLGKIEWKWSACAINGGAGSTPNWGVHCGAAKPLPPGSSGYPEWSTCDSSRNAKCNAPIQ
jgi:hypothetical protein